MKYTNNVHIIRKFNYIHRHLYFCYRYHLCFNCLPRIQYYCYFSNTLQIPLQKTKQNKIKTKQSMQDESLAYSCEINLPILLVFHFQLYKTEQLNE